MHGRGAKRVTLTGDKSVRISPRHRSGAIQMNYYRSTCHDARSTERWDSEQKKTSKSVKKVCQKRGPRTSICYSLKLIIDPLFSELRKTIMSKHQCSTACVHLISPSHKSLNLGRTKNERKSRVMRLRTTKRFAQWAIILVGRNLKLSRCCIILVGETILRVERTHTLAFCLNLNSQWAYTPCRGISIRAQ